jgi:hypothetical protein
MPNNQHDRIDRGRSRVALALVRGAMTPTYRFYGVGLVPALLATVFLAGCAMASGTEGRSRPSGPPTPTPSAQTAASSGTPIRIAFDDTELSARLHDNATARDLASQLPLTLNFRDFNSVEKIAPLPRELSLEGVPAGDDPAVGEIGYYVPDRVLVLYYGDVGFFNGIVRLGEIDGAVGAIERRSEDFTATIERG